MVFPFVATQREAGRIWASRDLGPTLSRNLPNPTQDPHEPPRGFASRYSAALLEASGQHRTQRSGWSPVPRAGRRAYPPELAPAGGGHGVV